MSSNIIIMSYVVHSFQLTVDWFIPSEASFKRCLIRKLLYDLLNEPSKRTGPRSRSNGDISSEYHDTSRDQKPTMELLNQHVGPSKSVLDNSTCSITVKGIEMNLETISSPRVANYDKQGLVMHEFLEPGTSSVSVFHQDAPRPRSTTCPNKVLFSCS